MKIKFSAKIIYTFLLLFSRIGLTADVQNPDQTTFNFSNYEAVVSRFLEFENKFKELQSKTNAFTNISFEESENVYKLLISLHNFRNDMKENQTLIKLDCTGLSVDICRETDNDLEVDKKNRDINQIVERFIDDIIIGWRQHSQSVDIDDSELVTLDLLTYLTVSEFYNMRFKGQLNSIYNKLIKAFPITAENVGVRIAILNRKMKKPYYEQSELNVNLHQELTH